LNTRQQNHRLLMEENKKKHISEITRKDVINALKDVEEFFGVKINIDEIESLNKKRKRSFKVKAKRKKKKTLSPNQDMLFEWLARKNGIHKDSDVLNEYERLQHCFNRLSDNQLTLSGLISLDEKYFKHLTNEEIKEYYSKKFNDFVDDNYSFKNRDFNELTRSEKILIKIFYDELY